MMFGRLGRQVVAVVATVSVVFAVETGHDTCADGRCDTNNLLQKSRALQASKLELSTGPSMCNFTDEETGENFTEQPFPCDIDPLKFGPLKAINEPACDYSSISVFDFSAAGTYTEVCRVEGLCLNACGINPLDNFIYCRAYNPDVVNGVPNAFVRITCPGLDGLANYDPPIDPVTGYVCFLGGRFVDARAASFDLEGNYYMRSVPDSSFQNPNGLYKLTNNSIQSLSASTTYVNDETSTLPLIEFVKELSQSGATLSLGDLTIVPEDLFGNGKMNYLVSCHQPRVIIINLDMPTEDIIELTMNMVDGSSTPSGSSNSQWYYNGTGTSYCAYTNGGRPAVIVAVLLNEITLSGTGITGSIPAGVVSATDSGNADGMNCPLATPAPFAPVVRPTPISCEHGFEDITFENSPAGFLGRGDFLTDNVFIENFGFSSSLGCLGPAILNESNAGPNTENLISGAPLLVIADRTVADNSGKVSPCASGGFIRLDFQEHVDLLGVELWNQFGIAPGGETRLQWRVQPGGSVGGVSHLNGLEAVNASLFINIAAEQSPPPRGVDAIAVNYGDRPGLRSIRVCRDPPSQPPPGVVGDPHIRTMDGHHYTLLRQGTFLLWRFTGPQITSSKAAASHEAKSSPVDWQLYAHYSGHASYTKGLLLLDTSSSVPHAFELTSRDCKWRSRKGEGEWTKMEKPQMLMVQEGAEHLTSIKVMWNTSDAQEGDYQHVKLKMNSPHGMRQMATLHISCRPNHLINTAIVMERPGDREFVQGQVGVTSKRHLAVGKNESGISALQTAQDQEFMSNKKWMELGGSSIGASYLHAMDDQGISLMQRGCSSAEEATASEICAKHLGKPQGHEMESFADCVYDVCAGGGETAAELLAVVMRKAKE